MAVVDDKHFDVAATGDDYDNDDDADEQSVMITAMSFMKALLLLMT